MPAPLHLTEDNLILALETLLIRASWRVVSDRLGMHEQTCYAWLHQSKRAKSLNDVSSPFYLRWRDENKFWHEHCAVARRDNIVSLAGLIADEAKNGTEVYARDPRTNEKCPKKDPRYLGVSDE